MVRCLNPSCGSYHVAEKTVTVNPRTLRVFASHPFWQGIGLGFACGIASIVLNFLFVAPNPHPSTLFAIFIELPILLIVFGFFLCPLWGIIQLIRKHTIGLKVHRYKCSTCGNKWVWPEGTPLPAEPDAYNPNPRLFEEERKRQTAAAVWAAYERSRGLR